MNYEKLGKYLIYATYIAMILCSIYLFWDYLPVFRELDSLAHNLREMNTTLSVIIAEINEDIALATTFIFTILFMMWLALFLYTFHNYYKLRLRVKELEKRCGVEER